MMQSSAIVKPDGSPEGDPKIVSNKQVTINRNRRQAAPAHIKYPFNEVVLAASLKEDKAGIEIPMSGILCPAGNSGKPLHTNGFSEAKEFLNFLLKLNYCYGVAHHKVGALTFRLYSMAIPREWCGYAGSISWNAWWANACKGIPDVISRRLESIKVTVVDGLPIMCSSDVLPRTNELTFILEIAEGKTEFFGWCVGPSLHFTPTLERIDVLNCTGNEIADQLEE